MTQRIFWNVNPEAHRARQRVYSERMMAADPTIGSDSLASSSNYRCYLSLPQP